MSVSRVKCPRYVHMDTSVRWAGTPGVDPRSRRVVPLVPVAAGLEPRPSMIPIPRLDIRAGALEYLTRAESIRFPGTLRPDVLRWLGGEAFGGMPSSTTGWTTCCAIRSTPLAENLSLPDSDAEFSSGSRPWANSGASGASGRSRRYAQSSMTRSIQSRRGSVKMSSRSNHPSSSSSSMSGSAVSRSRHSYAVVT